MFLTKLVNKDSTSGKGQTKRIVNILPKLVRRSGDGKDRRNSKCVLNRQAISKVRIIIVFVILSGITDYIVMTIDITTLVEQLSGELNDKAYKASDTLGRIGTDSVVDAVIELLNHPYPESRIMAARTLGLIENNSEALEPLLQAIKNKENSNIAGDLLVALEGFDVSSIYVELFKLYLFGSFKISTVSKNFLDYKEFNITPRVIKKAQKHWDHYSNNVKQDEEYALLKIEVEEVLKDLEAYLD
jgi:hypothetical protein